MAGQQSASLKYHPALDPRNNLIFMDHQKKEQSNSTVPEIVETYLGPARCAYRGQRRSRTWQSHRAAPQASPLVYTAREIDPCQGLKCLRCGPFRAPYPGSPILLGASMLSPAPHPVATSQ